MSFRRLLGWLPTLLIIAVGALSIWQKQNLIDWWRLRNYNPPARIVQLANDTTMNDQGKKLFFVHRPELADKDTFNKYCHVNEESIILGCYLSHRTIYIYDVRDERLKGIHEVTAAHEMLHAAYDRLSRGEREKIDKLLTDFFATVKDERLINTVESYRKRDPTIVPNELHSIVATEIMDIPGELETHYSRYFTDRKKVVEFSQHYEQAFTDLKNQVIDFDARLLTLKTSIDQNEAALTALSAELNADRARLDAQLAANDTNGYNQQVPAFNQKVRRYNNLLSATKALIAQYNDLVEQRNVLAAQEAELIKAIDSRLDTQEQE